MTTHLVYIFFVFALGACVGSFLNVVVWRLPRVEEVPGDGILRSVYRSWQALSYPPSHCPKCGQRLKWYDNIPVLGWIKLGGRCRFCKEPISRRYPIVEAITGLLFVLYYVMLFMAGVGPCIRHAMPEGPAIYSRVLMNLQLDWPLYALYMALVSGLLAASLIDAELFIIPIEIPWLLGVLGLVVHTLHDQPSVTPGAVNAGALSGALAAGAGAGLVVSFVLWRFGVLPTSFDDGGPLMEVEKQELSRQREASARDGATVPEGAADEQPLPEYTPGQIRREMRKEMLFLMPPLALGMAAVWVTLKYEPLHRAWEAAVAQRWLSALLGSVFGMLVGGFVVWLTRILGTIAFGREAMGMGDVHLMAGVGAVLGAGSATVAFFLAPFFGIAVAIYMLATGTRKELPYGPYLSLATAFVMLFYCPIAEHLEPGMAGLLWALGRLAGGGGA